MPTRAEHEFQIGENQRVLSLLKSAKAPVPGWEVVVLFYTAVHQVERYLAESSCHSNDHWGRNDLIKRSVELKRIWHEYSDLKDLAHEARYLVANLTPIDADRAGQDLNAIETAIDALVTPPL